MDLVRGEVVSDGGGVVSLTTRELELLSYLAENSERDIARAELLREVWGFSERATTRATDNAIRRLRAKLEDDPKHPRHLITVRGAGYRFVLDSALPTPVAAPLAPVFAVGAAVVDLGHQRVVRDGELVPLSRRESLLLGLLKAAGGAVVGREVLEREGWGSTHVPPRALAQAVARIRRKIGGERQAEVPLRAVRRQGYELDLGVANGLDALAEFDRFVGREREMRQLATRLGGPGLTTLKGTGGAGKTRLAKRAASAFHETGQPVVFCKLEDAREEQELIEAVCRALGLPPSGGSELANRVGRRVATLGPGLVVLDNFEQLAEWAPVLSGWRLAAPEARWLVTSRERLGLRGEHVIELGGLSEDESLLLLRDRAGERGVVLDDEPVLVELVEILDGVPLALELAGARFTAIPPREVLEGLRRGAEVLERTQREGSERHCSLRRCVDWSLALLTREQSAALAALVVFRGGFDVAAALHVLPGDEHAATQALVALMDRSMLHRRGERYGLIEAVRAHVARALPVPKGAVRRHFEHFGRYGEEVALAGLVGPDAQRTFVRYFRELANLRQACRAAITAGNGAAAIGCLQAIWEVLALRGPLTTSLELAKAALAGCVLSDLQRGHAERIAGRALHRSGDFEGGRALYRRALDAFADAPQARARVHIHLGGVARQRGERTEALAEFDLAEACLAECPDRRMAALLAASRGLCWAMGAPEGAETARALALIAQASVTLRELGDVLGLATMQGFLGDLYLAKGEPDLARVHYAVALEAHRRFGNDGLAASMLTNLGVCAAHSGHVEASVSYTEAALPLHRSVGRVNSECIALCNLMEFVLKTGEPERARQLGERAVALQGGSGGQRALALAWLAVAHHRLGQVGRARCLFAEAEFALPESHAAEFAEIASMVGAQSGE